MKLFSYIPLDITRFLIVSGFAAVMFAACGDGDSSTSVNDNGESELSSSSKASVKSSSSASRESSSSAVPDSGNQSSATVEEGLSSAKSSSAKSSSAKSSSSSAEPECTVEGEVTLFVEDGARINYICTDGFWVVVPESSSSSARSSSSYYNLDSLFNSNVTYGEFVDERDGQKYRTITIRYPYKEADSITIMAQNLNYGKQIMHETTEFDDSVAEKYCYNDDPWYCENGFGGLYSWSETLGLPKICDSTSLGSIPECPAIEDLKYGYTIHQGVCPDGWHVMTNREWNTLDGKYEYPYPIVSQAMEGSNGTGFSALLGGGVGAFNAPDENVFGYIGKYGFFWYPNESDREGARTKGFASGKYYSRESYKRNGASVRCTKDYEGNNAD